MEIMEDSRTAEYKLTILYILRIAGMPLEKKHIVSFLQKGNFMNYFLVGHTIIGLFSGGFLDIQNGKYALTEKGSDTLDFLIYKLPKSVRRKVDSLMGEERAVIREDLQVTADYVPGMKKDFLAVLSIQDGDNSLMELKISCGTKKEAMNICQYFKAHAGKVYQHLTDLLMEEKPD